MAILRQTHNHQNEMTGLKGVLSHVDQGLKIYGTLKGAYQVGSAIYRGAQVVAPIIAGLL